MKQDNERVQNPPEECARLLNPPLRTVKRRFFSNTISGLDTASGHEKSMSVAPTMSHFDVKIQTSETKLDHLRMYYCDFFDPSCRAESPITADQRTIEVDKMCEWLLRVSPRTRFDAYPLWIITKDILRRFVSRDVALLDRHAAAQRERIEQLGAALNRTTWDLQQAEQRLLTFRSEAERVADLTREAEEWKGRAAALQLELARSQDGAAQLKQQLERQEATLTKRMEARVLEIKASAHVSRSKLRDRGRTRPK